MERSAYVLRISPGGIDKVPEALAADQLIIGWSQADGLHKESLTWEEFRQRIQDTYYSSEVALRRAGAATGHMWRFIREMKVGDLVVVPYGPDFYVAEVIGSAVYLPTHKDDGTAYRRPVRWLNDKKPIPRKLARSALISRMKILGTCADASDLVGEIKECLNLATGNQSPTFQSDLKARLIRETLTEMRGGRIDDRGFEHLIKTVLESLGAERCHIVTRNQDKGADLIAVFRVAGAFQLRVAVQAKHWQPEPPVGRSVIEQLIRGIEAEMANLGMVITSGTISDDADQAAKEYFDDKGIQIELVDGEQFAKLIVEHGINAI